MTTQPGEPIVSKSSAPRPRRLVVAGLVVLTLLLAALAWHLIAQASYDASARPGKTSARLASAQMAAQMEPWNEWYKWRVVGLQGLTLLEQGKVRPAYFLIEKWMPIVFARDATFIEIYKVVRAAEFSMDSGQPHVAHGLDPYNRFSPPGTPSATYTTWPQTP